MSLTPGQLIDSLRDGKMLEKFLCEEDMDLFLPSGITYCFFTDAIHIRGHNVMDFLRDSQVIYDIWKRSSSWRISSYLPDDEPWYGLYEKEPKFNKIR